MQCKLRSDRGTSTWKYHELPEVIPDDAAMIEVREMVPIAPEFWTG